MRALQISAYDSALELVEKPVPVAGKGEVLVQIRASPINPSDLMFLRGDYGRRKSLPIVPGFEASGVVLSGSGIVPRGLVGRLVACGAPEDGDGTWAEYMVTPWSRCLPIVTGLGAEPAAMLLTNPLTALALVEIAKRGRHRTVVQTAGAGALGRMVIAWGKRNGVATINIVRRPEQARRLQSLGAEFVISSGEPEFEQHLTELCERLHATMAFDSVAGELSGQILKAMPDGAKLIIVGAASREACQVDPLGVIFDGKSVLGFWLADWFRKQNWFYQLWAGFRVQQLAAGEFGSQVRERVPLETAAATVDRYAGRMTEGKILIVPGFSEDE